MARQAINSLYESAIPLAEAWEVFASPEHRDALLSKKGALEVTQHYLEEHSKENLNAVDGWRTVLSSVTAGATAMHDRASLVGEMREELLDALYNSELIALGLRQRPSKGHYPVQIDADFFEYAKPNWKQSSLEWEGKLYSGVRIYDPRDVEHAAVPVPKRGSIEAIDEVISELKKKNPNFCNLPRKIACEEIRVALGQSENSGNGLSDKNLSKRILLQCPQRKIAKN